jgi:hypothetical protein
MRAWLRARARRLFLSACPGACALVSGYGQPQPRAHPSRPAAYGVPAQLLRAEAVGGGGRRRCQDARAAALRFCAREPGRRPHTVSYPPQGCQFVAPALQQRSLLWVPPSASQLRSPAGRMPSPHYPRPRSDPPAGLPPALPSPCVHAPAAPPPSPSDGSWVPPHWRTPWRRAARAPISCPSTRWAQAGCTCAPRHTGTARSSRPSPSSVGALCLLPASCGARWAARRCLAENAPPVCACPFDSARLLHYNAHAHLLARAFQRVAPRASLALAARSRSFAPRAPFFPAACCTQRPCPPACPPARLPPRNRRRLGASWVRRAGVGGALLDRQVAGLQMLAHAQGDRSARALADAAPATVGGRPAATQPGTRAWLRPQPRRASCVCTGQYGRSCSSGHRHGLPAAAGGQLQRLPRPSWLHLLGCCIPKIRMRGGCLCMLGTPRAPIKMMNISASLPQRFGVRTYDCQYTARTHQYRPALRSCV